MFSDRELDEKAKSIMKSYMCEQFKYFKKVILNETKAALNERHYNCFDLDSVSKLYVKDALLGLMSYIRIAQVYDLFLNMSYCFRDKDFLNTIKYMYKYKDKKTLEKFKSVLSERIDNSKPTQSIYHTNTYIIGNFWMEFCMKYDLLFFERNIYEPIYNEYVEKLEEVEKQFRCLNATLYRLYEEDDYIEYIASYLNIDEERNLLFGINTKQYILDSIELRKLTGSDLDIDDNFNLVFQKNKNRWNLIKQLATISC